MMNIDCSFLMYPFMPVFIAAFPCRKNEFPARINCAPIFIHISSGCSAVRANLREHTFLFLIFFLSWRAAKHAHSVQATTAGAGYRANCVYLVHDTHRFDFAFVFICPITVTILSSSYCASLPLNQRPAHVTRSIRCRRSIFSPPS